MFWSASEEDRVMMTAFVMAEGKMGAYDAEEREAEARRKSRAGRRASRA